MKVLYVVGALVLVALVGAGGFYGGVTYAQSQNNNGAADFIRSRSGNGAQQAAAGPCGFGDRTFSGAGQNGSSGQNGQNGQTGQNGQAGQGGQGGQTGQRGQGGQGGAFGNFAQFGNCVARGTIKSVSGNTVQISTPVSVVTVTIGDQTIISKTDVGSLSDLKTGDRVTVFSKDTGSSPAASMVQLQQAPTQTGQ